MDATHLPGEARERGTSIWDRVLQGVLVSVGVYGLALVVAGRAISDTVFDRLGFGLGPTQGTPDRVVDHVLLVYGVLGAVILGWAVLMVLLAVGPLARRERWAWWTVVASTSAWFVVDTAMSMARSYVGHAAFNLVFLVALGVPLLGIRGRLHPTSTNFLRR